MDYKKIIKSRETRQKILALLSFVPDKFMIKLQYRIKTGRKLNLKNPKRFTEKLQYYKLYYRDPLMKQCADKYSVRKYVSDCGFENILIPLIGVYDSVEKIDFSALPNKFVAKDTLGGGGNSVIICKNKNKTDYKNMQNIMKKWTEETTSYKTGGREWVYGGRRHRIIIEEYLDSNADEGGLIDYKFFCFHGKCEYIYVIADRIVGQKAGFGIFDREYNRVQALRCDEKLLERDVKKPSEFKKMRAIAEKLAAPFPEARIDLYFHNNTIRFGEITFFDGSGYMTFDPDEFDYEFGAKFDIERIKK